MIKICPQTCPQTGMACSYTACGVGGITCAMEGVLPAEPWQPLPPSPIGWQPLPPPADRLALPGLRCDRRAGRPAVPVRATHRDRHHAVRRLAGARGRSHQARDRAGEERRGARGHGRRVAAAVGLLMDVALVNAIVRRTYQLATQAAMNGRPYHGIQWVPPQSAGDGPMGAFVVTPFRPLSGSAMAPWEG